MRFTRGLAAGLAAIGMATAIAAAPAIGTGNVLKADGTCTSTGKNCTHTYTCTQWSLGSPPVCLSYTESWTYYPLN